ncbi:uncharacterized protein METZ01_LOCUS129916 [marine metagenome]|uniref:Uncharacterized protein n=1 Tax=marine metagenome TaxID=408172 RepID=A0A381YKE3_9ZZZZ
MLASGEQAPARHMNRRPRWKPPFASNVVENAMSQQAL